MKLRDGYCCQRCGKFYPDGERFGLHASHFIGRANKAVRYDLENLDTACYGCHQVWETHKATHYRDWKIKQLGEERFKALIARSNIIKKWTPETKKALYEEYKLKIKEIIPVTITYEE